MKSVVHKTPGKLDLRSISVFGLNSKPNTDTPIGYFGTGLKYAVAVFAREKVKFKIVIGGKEWIVEADPTKFRDKEFTELYLCSTTIGGLIKKRIKLPFTTEFGKNWTFWQAFRELHSNTLDEKGSTFLSDEVQNQQGDDFEKNTTYIIVEDERYVEEYYNRDRTFLPEGLRMREGTETLQVFDKPALSVYYRGIRIFDFPEGERSELTYNILTQIKLTEDRTAAEPYVVRYLVENYLVTHTNKEIIKKVVTAPRKTYESSLQYRFGSVPSPEFIETLEEVDENTHLNYSAREIRSEQREKHAQKLDWDNMSWEERFVDALERGNYTKVEEVFQEHKDEIKKLLGVQEHDVQDTTIQPEVPNEPEVPQRNYVDATDTQDDIPF